MQSALWDLLAPKCTFSGGTSPILTNDFEEGEDKWYGMAGTIRDNQEAYCGHRVSCFSTRINVFIEISKVKREIIIYKIII